MLPWNNWNIVESGAKQDWFDWFIEFNSTFSNIMATSFSGGRSRSTQREPPTMGKQLVVVKRESWRFYMVDVYTSSYPF